MPLVKVRRNQPRANPETAGIYDSCLRSDRRLDVADERNAVASNRYPSLTHPAGVYVDEAATDDCEICVCLSEGDISELATGKPQFVPARRRNIPRHRRQFYGG
jgi:hypothetical protein